MFYKKYVNLLPATEKQAAHLSIAVDKEHTLLKKKVKVKTGRNVVHEHSCETSKDEGTIVRVIIALSIADSLVVQASFELIMWPRMTLNSRSSVFTALESRLHYST